MNPLKQGLKLDALKSIDSIIYKVKEVNPLKQGLKLGLWTHQDLLQNFVKEVNPLKQGLKPLSISSSCPSNFFG